MWYVKEYDTDGTSEVYGPFNTQAEAREKMSELIDDIDLDACADTFKRDVDSFWFSCDYYRYFLRVEKGNE